MCVCVDFFGLMLPTAPCSHILVLSVSPHPLTPPLPPSALLYFLALDSLPFVLGYGAGAHVEFLGPGAAHFDFTLLFAFYGLLLVVPLLAALPVHTTWEASHRKQVLLRRVVVSLLSSLSARAPPHPFPR